MRHYKVNFTITVFDWPFYNQTWVTPWEVQPVSMAESPVYVALSLPWAAVCAS